MAAVETIDVDVSVVVVVVVNVVVVFDVDPRGPIL